MLPRSIPFASKLIPSKGKMKGIEQIPSANGYHRLTMAPMVRKQSRALQKMLMTVKPLQVRANKICKEMSGHYKNIELCLKDLKNTTQELKETYEKADHSVHIGKLDAISEWYSSLNDAFTNWEQIHTI